MRIGLIADVHANLFALQATLAALRRAGTDRLVCAGDLVGYGPHPNECVDVLANLDVPCVAGNHDLMAVGLLSDERCGPLARNSQRWTREALSDDTRRYLASLPGTLLLDSLVVAHGALREPQTYVLSDAQASEQLSRLARDHPEADFLVLGHTHRPWVYPNRRDTVPADSRGPMPLDPTVPHLLNPGSVGQSRSREWRPRARYLVLDAERRTVELGIVNYDVAACRDALRRHGLPRRSVHAPPRKARKAARTVKRALYRH